MVSKDILWKGIIEDLFDDFLRYFFPALVPAIDFTQPFEFLDKELDTLLPESKAGNKRADKLVKAKTKQGTDQYFLLHIEVQGYKDEEFAYRMFNYFYRILERWETKVTALAIFTDDIKSYMPDRYVYDFAGTQFVYKFNVFKVLHKTEQELELKGNPFSIIMKVARKALRKRELSDTKQLIWKAELTKELYQAGYNKQKIQQIFDFLRFYVRFTDESNTQVFDKNVEPITKPIKPMGIREAIETEIKRIGFEEGKKEDAFGMFSEGLSPEAIARITKLPLATILEWQKEWKTTK